MSDNELSLIRQHFKQLPFPPIFFFTFASFCISWMFHAVLSAQKIFAQIFFHLQNFLSLSYGTFYPQTKYKEIVPTKARNNAALEDNCY